MLGGGDKNTKVAFVVDHPTWVEASTQKLFTAGTGYTFESLLTRAGMTRNGVYVTSLFSEAAKDSKVFFTDKNRSAFKNEYLRYVPKLEQELRSLPNLKIVVPLGNASLFAVCGVASIRSWRGSVIEVSPQFSHYGAKHWKVVPTLSPRVINEEFPLRVFVISDLQKAQEELRYKGIRRLSRLMLLKPTFDQAVQYLTDILEHKRLVGTDIESETIPVTCISFATSAQSGICIPFVYSDGTPYWTNPAEEKIISDLVHRIINDPEIPKILQNGMYDYCVMKHEGYDPQNLSFDTMFAAHLLYCELPKDLGTLTSLNSTQSFYKFERTAAKKEYAKTFKPRLKEIKKEQSETRKVAKKRATLRKRVAKTQPLKPTPKRTENLTLWTQQIEEMKEQIVEMTRSFKGSKANIEKELQKFREEADITYWAYNTLDSQVLHEIREKQVAELHSKKLWDFFQKYYIQMFPIAFEMSMTGMKVDTIKRDEVASAVDAGIERMRQDVFRLVGCEFNTQSSGQMADVLYGRLNLPEQYKQGRVTTDVEALHRLHENTNNPVLGLILDLRKLEKLSSTYLHAELENGRMLCHMGLDATTSGRWNSKKTSWGTGGNLQNIPSGKTEMSEAVLEVLNGNKDIIRDCYIPSTPDSVILDIDLSNADTWFTAFNAKDQMLMEALVQGKDTHRLVAAIIYEMALEAIAKDSVERANAKKVGHGYNYGMTEKKMAKMTKLPLEVVMGMYQRLRETRPAIIRWHRHIEKTIMDDHVLYNAWGRPRVFFGRTPFRWSAGQKVAVPDEVYRSGYSYIPQSSVADTIGHVLLRVYDKLKGQSWGRILLQVHDSIVVECKRSHLAQMVKILDDAFNFTMNPWGDEFQIPWDFAIGVRWGSTVKLPVKNGEIDWSKQNFTDADGSVKESPWVQYARPIENS